MSDETKPKRGDIAICSVGCLGLITCDEPQEITYADGNKGVAWTGIQLVEHTFKGMGSHSDKTFTVQPGGPWSSRHPRVVGNSQDILGKLKDA